MGVGIAIQLYHYFHGWSEIPGVLAVILGVFNVGYPCDTTTKASKIGLLSLWFLGIQLMAYFSGILTSHLSIEEKELVLNSFDDTLQQDINILSHGSMTLILDFIEAEPGSVLNRIWVEKFKEGKATEFMKNDDEQVFQDFLDMEPNVGLYTYLSFLQFYLYRKGIKSCNFAAVPYTQLSTVQMAVPMREDFEYVPAIDHFFGQIWQSGSLDHLRTDFTLNSIELCPDSLSAEDSSFPLGYLHTYPAFGFLLAGLSISIVLVIYEGILAANVKITRKKKPKFSNKWVPAQRPKQLHGGKPKIG